MLSSVGCRWRQWASVGAVLLQWGFGLQCCGSGLQWAQCCGSGASVDSELQLRDSFLYEGLGFPR